MLPWSKTNYGHLLESLEAYASAEKLEGSTAFDCGNCESKTAATKAMRVTRFPQCLIIHINRFRKTSTSTTAADRWTKYTSHVNFPLTGLAMGALAAPRSDVAPDVSTAGAAADAAAEDCNLAGSALKSASAEDPVYDLYAVINHFGSRDIGHYTAFCKVQSPDGSQQWLKFDDDKVSEVRRACESTGMHM